MRNQTVDIEIEDCVNQLLTVLDHDIDYLEANIARLNELRALVVKQDSQSLSTLLAAIQSAAKRYQGNELKRQMLRVRLAALLSCSPKEITLTRMETHVTNGRNADIASRKNRLQALTGLLKKEYLGVQMLLADCARFNRLLLKIIFETGRSETITYKPTGAAQRQTDTVFMNLQF